MKVVFKVGRHVTCPDDLNYWIAENGIVLENNDSKSRTITFVASYQELDLFFC